MSQFFRNLLDRHQQGSGNQAGSRIVAPRPKARFESSSETISADQNVGLENDDLSSSLHPGSGRDKEVGAIVTENNSQARRTQKIRARPFPSSIQSGIRQQTANQTESALSNDGLFRDDDLSEPMEITTKGPEIKSFAPDSAIAYPNNSIKNKNQTQEQSLNAQRVSFDPPDSGTLLASDLLDRRIQTLLHHFNSPQFQTAIDDNTHIEPKQLAAATRDLAVDADKASPYTGVPMEQNTQQHKIGKKRHLQQGLLQTPSWLSELQTELNKRLDDAPTRPPQEPVINVTIGRIEVRATQNHPKTHTKTSHQPSGIMSLDEYLAQRNRKQP